MAYEFESELESMAEFEDEFEGELEGEFEGEFEGELELEAEGEGEGWLGAIGNIAGSLLGESEFEEEGELEDEFAGEFEDEYELSPIRKIYPDAMMEHLGELAAEAESEDEAAEHFLPLIGMAASKLLPVVARAVAPAAKRALPHIAKTLTRATPHLTRSVGKVAKVLHQNPQTRHLLRTVPGIARRTVGHIARQVARGKTVTPRHAVQTLARQAKHVLGTKQHRVHALRRHNHLERRFHGNIARGLTRPHPRYGHAHRHGHAIPGRTRYGTTRSGYTRGIRRTSYPGGVTGGGVPSAGAPRRVVGGAPGSGGAYRPGVVGGPIGRSVGGRCSCGGTGVATAYCSCCGQVLR